LLRHLETLIPGAERYSIFTNENETTVRGETNVQYNINSLEHDFRRITGYHPAAILYSTALLDLHPGSTP